MTELYTYLKLFCIVSELVQLKWPYELKVFGDQKTLKMRCTKNKTDENLHKMSLKHVFLIFFVAYGNI